MSPMIKQRRRLTAFIAAIFALSLLSPACYSAVLDPNQDFVTDVIVGHNTKGPYTLSWTNVDQNSITAVVNGRSLKKGKDFNIDPAKGMMAFDSVVANDSIVRITYKIIPGKSQKTTGKFNIPVSLNVFQSKKGSIKVSGLYAQDDPNNPNAGKTVFGLEGERSWAGTKINSQFLVSDKNATNNAGDQSGTWERASVKVGSDTSVGDVKIKSSFSHAGSQFAGAKEYGVGVGKDITDVSADYSTNKQIKVGAKFLRSEDTGGNTKGNHSTLNQQTINWMPVAATKLMLTHTQTVIGTAAANSDRTVDSSQMKLEQDLGSKTHASAMIDNSVISSANFKDTVRTMQASMVSNPNKRVNLRSMVSQKTSEMYGNEQSFSFGVNAKPIDQVSVDMAYGTATNNAVGHQTTTDIKVTASPIQSVAVQAAMSTVDSSKNGQSTKTNVSVQASPLKNVQIKSSLAGSAQNQNEQFQRDVSLTGTPAKYAKITALMSQKGINNWDDVTKGAALELTPVANASLSAGYRYNEYGSRILTVTDYAASMKPWSFFSASGSFRNRELNQDIAPDSTAFALALSPWNVFALTGDYQYNPEDKTGNVQNYKSTNVGLSTKIGSIGITSNYKTKNEYLLNRLSDEQRFGLELAAFGHGKICSGYNIARQLDGSQLATRTYSLGYKHAVGSDFTLSLNGYLTQYMQNKIMQPDKNEVSAEASFGIKF